MPRIPEETLEQILEATDIVDLIGSYFPLKRKGADYWACCPFHVEKSPSFKVSNVSHRYYCFGCKKTGSAIGFVQDYEGIPFKDAVRKLADKAGIRFEEEVYDPEEESRARLRSSLFALHKDIARWFHQLLFKHSIAEGARSYLKKRGLGSETAREWQIGYAPAASGLLTQWAAERSYSKQLLIDGGLLSLSEERGDSYARFRDRLMFPIHNDYGEVIAFSGRILDPESKAAKYMNSPETLIFKKSKTFFGLHKSRRAILQSGSAIVFEGQIDLISAYEQGIQNSIAPLGTAFTEQHARTLARHTEEVVLCFDSDTAGYKAAERSFAELVKAGIYVRAATLPPGEDPDSLIKKEGPDAFRERLAKAADFFDFQMDHLASSLDLASPRDRVRFAAEIAQSIARVENKISQDATINRVATRLATSPAEIRSLVAEAAQQERSQTRFKTTSREAPSPGITIDRTPMALQLLLRLALTDPESRSWLRESNAAGQLRPSPESELLHTIVEAEFDPHSPSSLTVFLSRFETAEESFLTSLLNEAAPPSSVIHAREALLDLRCAGIKSAIESTQNQLTTLPARAKALSKEEYLRDLKDLTQRNIDLTNERKELLDQKSRLSDIAAPH